MTRVAVPVKFASRSIIGVVFTLMLAAQTASGQSTTRFWVDAENGDDSHSGGRLQPFKTLNHALDVAWDTLHPSPGVELTDPIQLMILYTETPIAPDGFGGFEVAGWGELNPPAFPIRMIDNVDIIGVPQVGTGTKPRIAIDEIEATVFYDEWDDPPSATSAVRAYFIGANACMVKGLDFDGSVLAQTCEPYGIDKCKGVFGIWTSATEEFDIVDCDLRGMHDGVLYNAPATTEATGVITGCTFSNFFSVVPTDPQPGHAGLWLVGQPFGSIELDVLGCTFEGSHDGIEVAVTDPDPNDNFHVTLNITSTQFLSNENGAELVGQGTLDVAIDGCFFSEHYNHTDTASAVGHLGGIVARGLTKGRVKVRRSGFYNNRDAIRWAPTGPNCCLDLGRDDLDPICLPGDVVGTDLGVNSFFLEYPSGWSDLTGPPFTVMLSFVGTNTPGTSKVCFARGNNWLPGHQGANAQGCVLGFIEGVENSPPPLWTDDDSLFRNFELGTEFDIIHLDTVCP